MEREYAMPLFVTSTNFPFEESAPAGGTATHQWPEDLMEIVHEPMGHTLDRSVGHQRPSGPLKSWKCLPPFPFRMRRFSTSLSNVERAEAAEAARAAESERVDHQEKYKRTYREASPWMGRPILTIQQEYSGDRR